MLWRQPESRTAFFATIQPFQRGNDLVCASAFRNSIIFARRNPGFRLKSATNRFFLRSQFYRPKNTFIFLLVDDGLTAAAISSRRNILPISPANLLGATCCKYFIKSRIFELTAAGIRGENILPLSPANLLEAT